MTLEFRNHQVLVLSAGSHTTQVQMGIGESILPPSFEIPTVVYERTADHQFSMKNLAETKPIYPIVGGRILNLDALLYFLKGVYRSMKPLDGLNPALYLVSSVGWTRRQIELITRFCFEEINVPALAIYNQSLCSSYAFLASDCLVVDVGYQKTEISTVLSSEIDPRFSKIINLGGKSINDNLQKSLSLNEDQIEDLKRSKIYEVLTDDQTRSSDGLKSLIDEDEGVVDIAAIVASGRTREILDKREQAKSGEEVAEVSNHEKLENSFTDRLGAEHKVGIERFSGYEQLLTAIVDAICEVVFLFDPKELERIFNNLVVVGKGSLPLGFKAKLLEAVESKILVKPTPSTSLSMSNGEEDPVTQMPTKVTLAKLPDHFPEWKNRKWEDYMFLGAQIGAKQVFSSGIEGVFVTRQDYNEIGPTCVSDILY